MGTVGVQALTSQFRQSQRFAVITLLDWRQVKNSKDSVFFVQIDKGKEITIPWDIQLPNTEGVHDLTSILILNPFEKLDKYNNLVLSSFRVGIDIKKSN